MRTKWAAFLKKAIDALALDPEPNGLDQLWAYPETGFPGCLLREVYPFRIYYQIANPNRVIILAIVPHPTRI